MKSLLSRGAPQGSTFGPLWGTLLFSLWSPSRAQVAEIWTVASIRFTNQQVFLDLLIKFIKFLFSSVHGYAGLVVAPFPAFDVVLVQVLVGQSQRAKAVAGVLLRRGNGSGGFPGPPLMKG